MSANPDRRLSRRDVLLGGAALAGLGAFAGCAAAKSPGTSVGGPSATVASAATVLPATNVAASTAGSADVPATNPAGAPAVYVTHGPRHSNQVALTFHLSGDLTVVTDLLDELLKAQVVVTVLAVGKWIAANPDVGHRIVKDGHELGNHTMHHLDMLTLDRSSVRAEIVDCGNALVPFIGSIGRWFRPSATVEPNQTILDEAGKAGYSISLGYDVDSRDNKDPGAAAVLANVKAGVQPGSIVSLHFGHAGTVKALPDILAHLASVNLEPVTMSTLMAD